MKANDNHRSDSALREALRNILSCFFAWHIVRQIILDKEINNAK